MSRVCQNKLDFLLLSLDQKEVLIYKLQEKRKNALLEYRKSKRSSSLRHRKKETAFRERLSPELRDLFEHMDPKMKKLLT